MRGPGSEPFAIASRKGTSLGEPTLCTVVKPAISVTHAFAAARYAASCVVSPGPAFFPSLPKLQVMCTCASIQPEGPSFHEDRNRRAQLLDRSRQSSILRSRCACRAVRGPFHRARYSRRSRGGCVVELFALEFLALGPKWKE